MDPIAYLVIAAVLVIVGIAGTVLPVIPGMETFKGKAFHTARWDYDYTGGRGDLLPPVYGGGEEGKLSKLSDKTVGFIGTGASAVQAVPAVAEAAKRLYVFQRYTSIGAGTTEVQKNIIADKAIKMPRQ